MNPPYRAAPPTTLSRPPAARRPYGFTSPNPAGPAPETTGTAKRGKRAVAAASVVALSAALLAGCSGEARPFEEAIEVQELDLATLEVVRPEGSITPLVVNAGQSVRFGLIGRNGANGTVEISGEDRDWRVSDPSVASISDDGVFVGRSDVRNVLVDVRIGDIVSQPFDVRVSTSVIAEIVPPQGVTLPTALDPCVGTDFNLEALYVDETRRALTAEDVVWTSDTEEAYADENADGSVTFSAQRPGGVQLTATAGQASFSLPLSVGETLESLDIGPATLAAEEGEEQQLTATGTFDDGNGGTRTQNITEGVVWSIASGDDDVASVSNEAGSRGLVSAETDGSATIVATCGDVFDQDVFEVQADTGSSGGDNGGLALEDASSSNRRTVRISEGSLVPLRVSTGSEYDASEDVTRDAVFEVDSDENDVANLLDGGEGEFAQLQLTGNTGTIRLIVFLEGEDDDEDLESRLTIRVEN